MKSWVKLYTDANHDPRTITLTWAQRGIWAALLALAGEMDVLDEQGAPTGELDTVAYTALRIRCDLPQFQEALAAFVARGMAEVRDGVVVLCRYAERQAPPPSHRRAAQRDRQRRHRAAQAVTSPSDAVTSVSPAVTTLSPAVTPPDTDTDTDILVVVDTRATLSVAPQQAPEPSAPPRTRPPRPAPLRPGSLRPPPVGGPCARKRIQNTTNQRIRAHQSGYRPAASGASPPLAWGALRAHAMSPPADTGASRPSAPG